MDGGEGHFVARFRRVGANPQKRAPFAPAAPDRQRQEAGALYGEVFTDSPEGLIGVFGGKALLLPTGLPDLSGLHVLRAGVELAQAKGSRLEPAHGVFMSRPKGSCRRALDFPSDSPQLLAFLRGEEIDCPEKGYTAVCVNGVVTGFGKASGGRLKNRYPKGLRLRG